MNIFAKNYHDDFSSFKAIIDHSSEDNHENDSNWKIKSYYNSMCAEFDPSYDLEYDPYDDDEYETNN